MAVTRGAADENSCSGSLLPGEEEVEDGRVSGELGEGSRAANEVVHVDGDAVEDGSGGAGHVKMSPGRNLVRDDVVGRRGNVLEENSRREERARAASLQGAGPRTWGTQLVYGRIKGVYTHL